MSTGLWETIGARIGAAIGRDFAVEAQRRAGGGCINAAYVI